MQKRLDPHITAVLAASSAPDWSGVGADLAVLALADNDTGQLLGELGAALNSAPLKMTVVSGYGPDRRISGTKQVEVTRDELVQVLFGAATALEAAVASATAKGITFRPLEAA